MENENKFVVRGKVTRVFACGIATKGGEKYIEYNVFIKVDTHDHNREGYVNVPYRKPTKVKVGDEVEATGYVVGCSSDEANPYLNGIRGETLTILERVSLKVSSSKTLATASLEAVSRKQVI